MSDVRAVKGMNDVLPDEVERWHRLESAFRETARRFGYAEVRTPVVEPTQLFVRSIGEATDIVEKEMYSFTDKGEDSLTLRPEGTAGAVRALIEHKVYSLEPVTKWYYVGPMFRRERPARGRYRQFWQAGLECFGDPGPFVDAEMISLVAGLLGSMGIGSIEVLVNSLGSGDTRARYREQLKGYFEPRLTELSADSQRRFHTNPLRILDSKVDIDREISAGAPKLTEVLSGEDRAHFDGLCQALEALGVRYRIEPTLVRGLDYYSRTLFEIQGQGGELGAQNTLCGGGRYDGLVKELGGPDLPSIGFAMGLERILLAMAATQASPRVDVLVAVATPELRSKALAVLDQLRKAGIAADADLRGQSLKSQLRRTERLGARLAIVLGPAELERGVAQVKDLAAHAQSEVALGDLAATAKNMLAGASGAA
jgi:histidyl-tRNA synthetase